MLDALDLRFYYKQIEKEPLRASRAKKSNIVDLHQSLQRTWKN